MLKVYKKNEASELVELLRKRAENISPEIINTVGEVLNRVRKNGDAALIEYTKQFDGITLDGLYLGKEERAKLCNRVPPELRKTMERAAENIRRFHEKQKQQGYVVAENGRVLGQRVLPLRRVGLYVPGGRAAYPSSVLMNAIPAAVAGVPEIILATPPKAEGLNPAVIFAAELCSVSDILTVGGAQAVAALAYGTESVKRVDKIVGPGNIFVAMAKKLVYGTVDIDMIAGPSEVLVIADEFANPYYVAADLMSQAEHDPLAAAVLVSSSEKIVSDVIKSLEKQLLTLERAETIKKSLESFGSAVIVDNLSDAVCLSNAIAPEHLELCVAEPFALLGSVSNAGSVFLGGYAPEPLGDYFAGPNHVLPTNGTARFSSALSVESFTKRSSYLYYDKASLLAVSDDVIRFADSEGLTAHANSIKVRKNS